MTHPGILETAREQVLERGEGLGEQQVIEVLRLPDDAVDDALALAHRVRLSYCGPAVEVESIISRKTGGCPEDCHFCSQSGQLRDRQCAPSGSTSRRSSRRRDETAAPARPSSASSPRYAGPDERLMDAGARGRRSHPRADVDINVACSLGILTRDAGARARRAGRAPLQPQPRDGALLLPAAWSRPTPGRSAGRRCSSCASRDGAVLWRHHRHGRDSRAARRARHPARRAGPRRGPAELPRTRGRARPSPTAGHSTPREALRTIALFRLAMPRRSCATPAAARSRSGISQAPGDARRHQCADRRQLPHDPRTRLRSRTWPCSTTCGCR